LQADWASISAKAEKTSSAPSLVHGEPDLAVRVVRDVFNEDFKRMLVQGEDAWATISDYVGGIAPDLAERISRHTSQTDIFRDLRVDEQLMKALDRKVYLPSGGSLVIDRTEAMTVIDVNTGKFVGSGGNLEQTVTRNNLEAAEEIVRQLRLRDVGGIVVIDFIDMVLESNRDLVLRRLTECLGRDRTKHQVAEVTSLGLVQMTRKRLGEGLLEAFSDTCEVCHGRGVIVHTEPVDRPNGNTGDDERSQPKQSARRKRGGGSGGGVTETVEVLPAVSDEQRQKTLTAMASIHRAAHHDDENFDAEAAAERELEAVEAALAAAEDSADANARAEAEAEAEAEVHTYASGDVTTQIEPIAEPEADFEPEPEADFEPEPEVEPEPDVLSVAELIEAEVDGTELPVRRRRRAATRPAGPPAGLAG
jgi:ribonuclease E